MKFIPYGRQDISDEDISAVVDVLKSEFLTQGPYVPKFEKTIANYVNVKHAVAVNSATSALHIACLALGMKKAIGFGHHQILLLLLRTVLFIVALMSVLLISMREHII